MSRPSRAWTMARGMALRRSQRAKSCPASCLRLGGGLAGSKRNPSLRQRHATRLTADTRMMPNRIAMYGGLEGQSGRMAVRRDGRRVIAELCEALGFTAPPVELLAPDQLPWEFHILLVHSAGMTSTLERHWRESVRVELLSDDLSVEQRSLFRFVVLRTQSSAQLLE